tara:strand:+ start:33556 stop:33996 length:441 start_codon:yes stop_codon:yes gene_type:complete
MPTRPTDLYTNNHWYFEIPGLVSPHFHMLEGIEKKSGEVSIVDGSTNIKHKFSSQLMEFNDIVLTRAMDGSIDDESMKELVRLSLDYGQRFDGQLIKMHNHQEVFRILFLGLRIKNVAHPSLDTSAEERYDIKYTVSVSEWVEVGL